MKNNLFEFPTNIARARATIEKSLAENFPHVAEVEWKAFAEQLVGVTERYCVGFKTEINFKGFSPEQEELITRQVEQELDSLRKLLRQATGEIYQLMIDAFAEKHPPI